MKLFIVCGLLTLMVGCSPASSPESTCIDGKVYTGWDSQNYWRKTEIDCVIKGAVK